MEQIKRKLKQDGITWVPVWKKDLLTSDNFNIANSFQRGVYLQLFLHCRDNDYPGQFCFPDGKPMTIDQIVDTLNLKKGDRRDRIKEAIAVLIGYTLLFWNKHKRLELRKYALKSAQGSHEVDTRLAQGSPYVGTSDLDNKGVASSGKPIREEKEQDKDESKKEISLVPMDATYQIALDIALKVNAKHPDRPTDWMVKTFIGAMNSKTQGKPIKGAEILAVWNKHPELNDLEIVKFIKSGQAKTETCARCKGEGEIFGGPNRGEIPCPECKP